MNKKTAIIFAIAISVCIGLTLGTFLQKNATSATGITNDATNGTSRYPINSIYRVSNASANDFSKLNEVLMLINTFYVDNIDTEKVTEDILPEVLHDLDPHSAYIPADEVEEANEDLNGSFFGIGVSFSILNDTVVIVDVISGGPSEKLGILPGDRIVQVGDSNFVGDWLTNTKVMKTLRGDMGTKVKVGIQRKNYDGLLNFEITRGKIPITSVDVAYMVNDSIGYIKVSRFAAGTHTEFVTELKTLREKGCNNFIIDLRGNSGGYLNTAISMIDEFFPANKLIVYTQGKIWPREDSYSSGKGRFADANICVLINEWSASASEIFAGAIQDHDRGWIIGRRSFGKGLVQQPYPLKDGSELRLTIARYYTPSGRCIQKPYAQGEIDQYDEEILTRFTKGELFSPDSISFADSLKYSTSKGRTVYGGGGIMPDYFIAEDTTYFSNYYKDVLYKGYVYQFAFEYSDDNRKEFSSFADYKELDAALRSSNMFDKFVNFAANKGVTPTDEDLKASKAELTTLLSAYVCRNIFGDRGFYPVFNSNDPTIAKAVEVICTEVD